MINRFNKSTCLFVLVLSLMTIDGCRKDYASTSEDMAEYGWVLYETAATGTEYLISNNWFQDAVIKDSELKDGYNGLGWTFSKTGDKEYLDSSISRFLTGLDLKQDEWNPINIQGEILAGLTFAYQAKGNDAKAIQYGRTFIDSTSKPFTPGWVFSHDSLLNYSDLRLALATSYFAKGKFDSTTIQVSVILDSINSKTLAVIASDSPDSTGVKSRMLMAAQLDSLQKILLKQ